MTTKTEALTLALEALEKYRMGISILNDGPDASDVDHAKGLIVQSMDLMLLAIPAIQEVLAQPTEQEPVLQNIEQYRMQMAGICTASVGYWKEGEGIHPDYDTIALRDVAKLYAKYAALYKTQPDLTDAERNFCPRCGKRLLGPPGPVSIHTCTPPNARTFDDYGNKIV